MELKKIWAVYFSGTGTTRRTVERIASGLAEKLALPVEKVDFSRPQVRQQELRFDAADLVVFGTPVYAGRVPNVLLPFLQEKIVGGGALAVPVVLFGNRAYDDALMRRTGCIPLRRPPLWGSIPSPARWGREDPTKTTRHSWTSSPPKRRTWCAVCPRRRRSLLLLEGRSRFVPTIPPATAPATPLIS